MTIAAVFFGLAAGFVCGCGIGPIQAVGLNPDAPLAPDAHLAPDAPLAPDAHLAPDAPLAMGMVAHWRFDEGRGTTLADSSGNHHDGTIVGSTWEWIAGRFGKALHLEQGDFVSVDDFPDATSDWTVAAWVQIPSQMIGTGTHATLVSTEDALKGGWELLVTDAKYHFGFYTGSPTLYDYAWAECSNCIRPDQWQHLAAVVDSNTNTLALYLDGALQRRNSIPKLISPGVTTLTMGRWSRTDPAMLLVGSLDDIAIWNRALSSSEIALLVQAPAP